MGRTRDEGCKPAFPTSGGLGRTFSAYQGLSGCFALGPFPDSHNANTSPASSTVPIVHSEGKALQLRDLLFVTPRTLCDPTMHGILQTRILEWVAVSFSRGYSKPRDRTQVFCIAEPRGKPSEGVSLLLRCSLVGREGRKTQPLNSDSYLNLRSVCGLEEVILPLWALVSMLIMMGEILPNFGSWSENK